MHQKGKTKKVALHFRV